jgi:hypothetical protein
LEAALPLDRAKETLAVESEVPVGATRQCLVSVLSRRAKTSFPGRGPLRCASWSFPAWGCENQVGSFRVDIRRKTGLILSIGVMIEATAKKPEWKFWTVKTGW